MKDFYDDDTDYMGDEDTDTPDIEKEEESPDWELEDSTEDEK
jgi:hypothetical protein